MKDKKIKTIKDDKIKVFCFFTQMDFLVITKFCILFYIYRFEDFKSQTSFQLFKTFLILLRLRLVTKMY